MIIEARPLHKKKKRLAKQRSIRETQLSLDLVRIIREKKNLRNLKI
jgi:hypothetical protein